MVWVAVGVAAFQLAFLGHGLEFLVLVYLGCLFELRRLPTPRRAFWMGTVLGLGVYGPQLLFLWKVFGFEAGGFTVSPVAPILWLVLAVFHGFFVLLLRQVERRHGALAVVLAAPVLWMGLEFGRCEAWWLRFAWFTVGETVTAWGPLLRGSGVYGSGALLMAVVATGLGLRHESLRRRCIGRVLALGLILVAWGTGRGTRPLPATRSVEVAGLQLETPGESDVLGGLDRVLVRHPTAPLIVLGEYNLDGPPSESVRRWCREHQRWLVVGGTEPVADAPAKSGAAPRLSPGAGGGAFRDTAFVVGPSGTIEFSQAKSVPIQFFQDGLPATGQEVWESPWGRLGLAVCYDASYRRVMDRLVRKGAEGLLVIAMDAESWGAHEHDLNARIGRLRAVEYGLPVFRVATSGVSQLLGADGVESARAGFPGPGETLGGTLHLAGPVAVPVDAWLGPVALGVTLGAAAWLAIAATPWYARKIKPGSAPGIA